jgi:hypothetical protein
MMAASTEVLPCRSGNTRVEYCRGTTRVRAQVPRGRRTGVWAVLDQWRAAREGAVAFDGQNIFIYARPPTNNDSRFRVA